MRKNKRFFSLKKTIFSVMNGVSFYIRKCDKFISDHKTQHLKCGKASIKGVFDSYEVVWSISISMM